jgi:hypothetical protein
MIITTYNIKGVCRVMYLIRIGEMKIAIFFRKSERKRTFGKPGSRWQDLY